MDGNSATGDWNIAHNPAAWELMFAALPDENLGLEWEPCHQLVYLIDPLPQIRAWASRIFHVHGKDATVRRDVIRTHGIFGKHPFVQMRTPGFGDSDWARVIGDLRLADQQPFLQGYLPILSLCQQVVYGLAPLKAETRDVEQRSTLEPDSKLHWT